MMESINKQSAWTSDLEDVINIKEEPIEFEHQHLECHQQQIVKNELSHDENQVRSQLAILKEDNNGVKVDVNDLKFCEDDRVLKVFIEKYETLPQLWNCTCPSYSNKYKRNEGLLMLREIYNELKPHASLSDVRKKINTLRSNFRREINKIKLSKGVYKPTSWVFYALSFLQETEIPTTLEDDESQEQHATQQTTVKGCYQNLPAESLTTSSSLLTPKQPPSKKQRQLGLIARQNELLKLACDVLGGNNDLTKKNDEYLNITKVWANKLKSLDPVQKRYAERAINEVLFEAESGTLHRNSVQINHDP